MNKRQTGSKWEDEAARYLTSMGLVILERNFRSRFGEIDIIAKDADYTVFIEVKYRKTASFGNPEEAVDIKKIRTISKVADYYRVVRKKAAYSKMRFDVIAIEGGSIKWYKNAFSYTS